LLGVLYLQDYFQFGSVWPIFYFIGLIIMFFIKQHIEDKELIRKNRLSKMSDFEKELENSLK